MKIYTYPKSRSLRVLWALEELEIPYETVKVDLLNRTSPHSRGKIPFMIDGETGIEETLAICIYLCNKYHKETFYPFDLKKQSRVNSYISFALTDLESPIWNLLKQLILIPEEKRSLQLINYFKRGSEKVIKQFKLETKWVTGDNFTLADIFISDTLSWAKLCGIDIDSTINDYINRATSRKSYVNAQARNNL